METPIGNRSPRPRLLGPVFLALAVGCRPFQAAYVPYVLLRLYEWRAAQGARAGLSAGKRLGRAAPEMAPYLILPALIAAAYGAYNYVRFGSALEFGHNYLPEFSTEGGVQFSTDHWLNNLKNILRLPYFEENRLLFSKFCGFAFYLCNPVYVLALGRAARQLARRTLDGPGALLLGLAAVHFNLLLLHRTFGGYQFGTRYLIDLIPMLALYVFRGRKRLSLWDGLAMLWGILFNIYGTAVFHLA